MLVPILPPILVLDPDPAIRDQFRKALQDHAVVMEAQTIAEAVQQITRRLPTVIVLEWNLPDGDGLAFIKRIHTDPTFADISIICVSQQNGVKDKVNAFHAGADDYVVHPIDTGSFWWRLVLLQRMRKLAR